MKPLHLARGLEQGELGLVSVHKPPIVVTVILDVLLLDLFLGAPVHVLIAFRPSAGVPSFRDVHAIRAAGKLAAVAETQEETRQEATAARNALSEARQARSADRNAAGHAVGRPKKANEAAKLAMHKSRADRAAAQAARQAADLEKARENAGGSSCCSRCPALPSTVWLGRNKTYLQEQDEIRQPPDTDHRQPSQSAQCQATHPAAIRRDDHPGMAPGRLTLGHARYCGRLSMG